mmetsp:Transcript_22880/g.53199  ORF Transcript_22880/g.53199 Transcript_22880/m.53199 type:complete len:360 (-) Transcript_22880:215-1294(-)
MVLQLVLHAPPQPLREGVAAGGVAGRQVLSLNKIRRLVEEELLALVSDGGDDSSHETRGNQSTKKGEGRHEGEHEGVVAQAPKHLGPELAPDGDRERIEPPEDKQHRHGDGPEPALVLARGAVVLRVGGPEEEGGVGGNVLVDANLVGAGVVSVVLVRPPRGAHSPAEGAEWPHDLAEPAPAVRVVVGEPPRDGVGDSQHSDSRKLHHYAPRELTEAHPESKGGGPRPNVEQLLVPLPLEPARVDELLPPHAEVASGLRHRRDPLGRPLGLGEALHHLHALGRVEPVHHLGGVLVLVEVDPVSASRVGRAPPREIIPHVVDAHQQLPVDIFSTLPQLGVVHGAARRLEGGRGDHPQRLE